MCFTRDHPVVYILLVAACAGSLGTMSCLAPAIKRRFVESFSSSSRTSFRCALLLILEAVRSFSIVSTFSFRCALSRCRLQKGEILHHFSWPGLWSAYQDHIIFCAFNFHWSPFPRRYSTCQFSLLLGIAMAGEVLGTGLYMIVTSLLAAHISGNIHIVAINRSFR